MIKMLHLRILVLLLTLGCITPAIAQNVLTVRSAQDFENSMTALKASIETHGYAVSHVQRCDRGLTGLGYETDRYRVVFFGKLDEFKTAAAACMKSVREKDTGTLQYDWFFNDDQSCCVVRERYRDSNAVLEHMGNLGAVLGELLELAGPMELEMFGDPSEELRTTVAPFGAAIYAHFQSL